ncbi:hypothetical protein SEA_PERMAG_40 [Microbacterium phage PermaG]|nr:hypothetical protein SEA_PERMAG_40 [Microbacterium phage PermaG]
MCAACMDPNQVCTEHGALARQEPTRTEPKVEILIDGEWVEVGGIKPDSEATGWRQELAPMTFMGVEFTQVAKDTYEITDETIRRADFPDNFERYLALAASDLGLRVWQERDIMRRVYRFYFEKADRRLPRGDA